MWRTACSILILASVVSDLYRTVASSVGGEDGLFNIESEDSDIMCALQTSMRRPGEVEPATTAAGAHKTAYDKAAETADAPTSHATAGQRSLVVTELANTGRHKNQFQALFYPSWNLMKETPNGGNVTVDLMSFCEPHACNIIPEVCKEVPMGSIPDAKGDAKCFFQKLGDTYAKSQYNYGLSLYFMTSPAFEKVVEGYDYVMRSDVDAILLPGLRSWVPEFGSAVGHGYMGTDFTQNRLEGLAKKFGLKHHGIHNMQSTFYVRANKVVPFAKKLVDLSKHFYEDEFSALICAEVERKGGHCAWSDWYRPVSTLYATDLAANEILGEPDFKAAQVTDKLDHCATDCWSWGVRRHGSLADTPFKAREVGQVHLLETKHWFYNSMLEQEERTEFCRLALKTWPGLKIEQPADWGSQDESISTYFLRVVTDSLPGMCATDV